MPTESPIGFDSQASWWLIQRLGWLVAGLIAVDFMYAGHYFSTEPFHVRIADTS
jgi:hypothetical protein